MERNKIWGKRMMPRLKKPLKMCEFSHIIKNYLYLKSSIFIKLSQTVCQIKTYILVYPYVRRDCFYFVFWVFLYLIFEHSCLKYYIFTKLSQIVYLINVHILICQYAKSDYRLWKVFWRIFNYFIYKSLSPQR